MLEHREDPKKSVTEYPIANDQDDQRWWTIAEIVAAVMLIIWSIGVIINSVEGF